MDVKSYIYQSKNGALSIIENGIVASAIIMTSDSVDFIWLKREDSDREDIRIYRSGEDYITIEGDKCTYRNDSSDKSWESSLIGSEGIHNG